MSGEVHKKVGLGMDRACPTFAPKNCLTTMNSQRNLKGRTQIDAKRFRNFLRSYQDAPRGLRKQLDSMLKNAWQKARQAQRSDTSHPI